MSDSLVSMKNISKVICYPSTFKILVIVLIILILVAELCFALCYKSSFFESTVKHTSGYSIIFMIVTFLYLSLDALFCSKEEKNKARLLVDVLKASLSVSAIPTGISLIVCSFPGNIKLIESMGGVEVYIAFAGLSIAAIGLLSTLQGQKDVENPTSIDRPEDTMKLIEDNSKVDDNNVNNLIDH